MTEEQRAEWERKERVYRVTRVPLEKIAKTIDLVAVVEAVTPIRLGMDREYYTAKCPFCKSADYVLHFRADGAVQWWHCFGCRAGGTVVKFIEKMIALVTADSDARLKAQQDGATPQG